VSVRLPCPTFCASCAPRISETVHDVHNSVAYLFETQSIMHGHLSSELELPPRLIEPPPVRRDRYNFQKLRHLKQYRCRDAIQCDIAQSTITLGPLSSPCAPGACPREVNLAPPEAPESVYRFDWGGIYGDLPYFSIRWHLEVKSSARFALHASLRILFTIPWK
jgi:hypothetical protein